MQQSHILQLQAGFISLLLMLSGLHSLGQSKIVYDAGHLKLNEKTMVKGAKKLEIVFILPERNFEKVQILIHQTSFSFNCQKNESCINLFASDIDSGAIHLLFEKGRLLQIGSRKVSGDKVVLKDDDTDILGTVSFLTGQKTEAGSFSFLGNFSEDEPADKNEKKPRSFTSSFCNPSCNEQAEADSLPERFFSCDRPDDYSCSCGIPVNSKFDYKYLPPCFAQKDYAVSVKNQLLYDMSENDGVRKVYLLELRGKKDTSCRNGRKFQYEYPAVKKSIRPRAGEMLAVTIIAHKDSSVIIDSNAVNYFLDSASVFGKSLADTAAFSGEPSLEMLPGKEDSLKTAASLRILSGAVSLSDELIGFNQRYQALKVVQEKYQEALNCLQLRIVRFFSLKAIPLSGNELASAIESQLKKSGLPCKYHEQACHVLSLIAAEYDKALQYQSDYRTYTQVFQVPNADELSIGIRTKNVAKALYHHDFPIKGGLKIDFSTGVFVTGLNSVNFVTSSQRFLFKDSARGLSRDTTGNLIGHDTRKFNFNTGLMVHIYPRTGRLWNVGGVAGVVINNGDFNMMLGGSAMFRMGKARFSLVGGLAIGKEKMLDANQQQYLHTASMNPPGKVYVQNSDDNRLPRFFTETNISTYDKLKLSWFMGITYNFASLNLGK